MEACGSVKKRELVAAHDGRGPRRRGGDVVMVSRLRRRDTRHIYHVVVCMLRRIHKGGGGMERS